MIIVSEVKERIAKLRGAVVLAAADLYIAKTGWTDSARAAAALARHNKMATHFSLHREEQGDQGGELVNSWSKKGGYADSKIAGVRRRAQALGFQSKGGKMSGNADGSHVGGGLDLVHPEGHVLSIASSFGVHAQSNWHSIRLTTRRP